MKYNVGDIVVRTNNHSSYTDYGAKKGDIWGVKEMPGCYVGVCYPTKSVFTSEIRLATKEEKMWFELGCKSTNDIPSVGDIYFFKDKKRRIDNIKINNMELTEYYYDAIEPRNHSLFWYFENLYNGNIFKSKKESNNQKQVNNEQITETTAVNRTERAIGIKSQNRKGKITRASALVGNPIKGKRVRARVRARKIQFKLLFS